MNHAEVVTKCRLTPFHARDTFCNWSDATPDVTKTYDAAGRLLTLSNSVASSTYSYDTANQLLSEAITISGLSGAKTVAYTYDADGNRATLTDPSGVVTAYTYTGRNQVASITADGPPPIATFTYDAAGNRVSKTLENGVSSTYTFDDANRLTSIVHAPSVETLSYTYDNVNRRTGETRTSGGLRSFGYDATGQLLQVSHSAGNATFSYDAVGNRLTVAGAPGAGSYISNALNQYTTAGTVGTLTHDTNGNLATAGTWTYTHNADSRLIGVSGPATASFGRDGRNRDVKRTINGTTTYLIYDGWNLVAEFDASGSLTTHYINGPRVDEILAKVTTTSTTFPLEDALGSTIAVTDVSGAVLERITYTDAFGTPSFQDPSGTPQTGTTTATRFLFTGREYLADLGIYDYRNRTYSPSLGRFIQADPIRFASTDSNLYRYVFNQPLRWTDRFGLCTQGDASFGTPLNPSLNIVGPNGMNAGEQDLAFEMLDAAEDLANAAPAAAEPNGLSIGQALGGHAAGGITQLGQAGAEAANNNVNAQANAYAASGARSAYWTGDMPYRCCVCDGSGGTKWGDETSMPFQSKNFLMARGDSADMLRAAQEDAKERARQQCSGK